MTRINFIAAALLCVASVATADPREGGRDSAPDAVSSRTDGPRFAVYRVDIVARETTPPRRGTRDPKDVYPYLTQEELLATAVKRGAPVLTERDIETYCWESQTLHLTAAGVEHWDSLGGWDVPLTGHPLLVEVDGEPRYGAFLWNPVSSLGCRLPQFWCRTLDGRLVIGGKFVTTAGDTIRSETYDPTVRQVMEELGKLSWDCGGHPDGSPDQSD